MEAIEIAELAPRDEELDPHSAHGSKQRSGSWNLLALMRRLHLYLGIFSAPAIVFFAFTGILQTLSLHEYSRESSYQPPKWLLVIAQIHKKQVAQVPPRKNAPAEAAKTSRSEKMIPASTPPPPNRRSALPMKVFFVVIGVALILSTASGIVMSWKFKRDRGMMFALLVAGIAIPAILLVL